MNQQTHYSLEKDNLVVKANEKTFPPDVPIFRQTSISPHSKERIQQLVSSFSPRQTKAFYL